MPTNLITRLVEDGIYLSLDTPMPANAARKLLQEKGIAEDCIWAELTVGW